jgi:SAM-dependent methyltransferase
MRTVRILRTFLLALCLIAAGAFAQTAGEAAEYEPLPGQSGKDVIWLPTARSLAEKMLDLGNVQRQDYVIDLGSGDGRIVIAAAKRGAQALGIEYNPDMVVLSKERADREGVADKARFIQADIFESDLSRATVITMFLLPELNLRLRPTILALKPGTRIVSNSFDMGDWIADRAVALGRNEACEGTYCQAFLWIVPARVNGRWKLPQGELTLHQNYQMLSGTLKAGGGTLPITDGQMNGRRISFRAGGDQYSGHVDGNAMLGVVRSGGNSVVWQGSRTGS